MENTNMKSAVLPMDPPTTPPTPPAAKKKEHWLVEVVSGMTVATTMVSALALWYVFADQLFSSIPI